MKHSKIFALAIVLACSTPLITHALPQLQESTPKKTTDYDVQLQKALDKFTGTETMDEKYGALKVIASLMNSDIQASHDSGKPGANIKEKERIAEAFIPEIQQRTLDAKKLTGLVKDYIKL